MSARKTLPASPSSLSQLHQKQRLQIHDWLCQRKRCHLRILVEVQHSLGVILAGGNDIQNQPRNGIYFRLRLAVTLQYLGNVFKTS